MLCAAPIVLISLANAPAVLLDLAPKGIRVVAAGAPPAASTIQRLEEEAQGRLHYGLTETAPFITVCEQRPDTRSSRLVNERRSKPARAS